MLLRPWPIARGDGFALFPTPVDKATSLCELRVVAAVKNASDKDLKVVKLGTVLYDEVAPNSTFYRHQGRKTGIETKL